MTWNAFHHRGDILRAVQETADHRRDGILPTDVPGVAEKFRDDLDLVGALQLKWHTRLAGNLERSMAGQPMDLESAVVAAWRTTAHQLPGVRLVIDHTTDHPADEETAHAMTRARIYERARLAQAAGLAHDRSERAVAAGARLEQAARAGLRVLEEQPAATAEPGSASTAVPSAEPAPEQAAEPSPADTPDRSRESFVERIKAALVA